MARKQTAAIITIPLIAGIATIVPFYIVQWILGQIGFPPFSYMIVNMSVPGIIGWIALLWSVGLVEYYAWREMRHSLAISLLE